MDKSGPILKTLFQNFENVENVENEKNEIASQLVLRDQNFITSFYDIFHNYFLINNEENEKVKKVEKIFNKIKVDVGQILYNYLKPFAYDASVPNELKIELDGCKFLFTFLDGAITTIDKKYYIYYESKFKFLLELFKEDTSVIVVEKKDIMIMEIYVGDILKETYELVQYQSDKIAIEENKSCPKCYKNFESKNLIICDNDCGTIYCDCGYQYYKIGDESFPTHNPLCGKDEYEDEDKYKVIPDKIQSNFYVRKRIFRHEFYNDAMINHLKLPQEAKEQVCKNFDKFSDDFSKKYQSKISFLPYNYLFFRLLSEIGYNYPYISQVSKFESYEKIFWSVKDVNDYDTFIFYVKMENMKKKELSSNFDKPLKFFIDKNISKNKRNYYTKTFLINAESKCDLLLKYFTKYLPKVENYSMIKDIYNLFILDMVNSSFDITFETIARYILKYIERDVVKLVEEEIEL